MKIPHYACKSDIMNVMNEWVIGLHAKRNCDIYSMKVIDGFTFENVAEEFDLTDRQVKNIVYKVNDIVCAHLPS